MTEATPKQLLHLVFGGELKSLDAVEFKDLDKLDMVGIYPNYATAYAAWKGRAQRTVDNAQMRYYGIDEMGYPEPLDQKGWDAIDEYCVASVTPLQGVYVPLNNATASGLDSASSLSSFSACPAIALWFPDRSRRSNGWRTA
jgi:hypothetical protein